MGEASQPEAPAGPLCDAGCVRAHAYTLRHCNISGRSSSSDKDCSAQLLHALHQILHAPILRAAISSYECCCNRCLHGAATSLDSWG